MKKLLIIVAIFLLLGVASAYIIKNDIHKKLLGENSAMVIFIEKKLGHSSPNFTKGMEGEIAPAFSLPSENGSLKLDDYKGKLILLNFWASWCPPCRAEMPGFIKIQEKYKDKPFTFIGVAIEDKDAALSYAKEIGVNYPIGFGTEAARKIANRYGNPDAALPYTVLISPEQKILHISFGFLSEETLEELITQNL